MKNLIKIKWSQKALFAVFIITLGIIISYLFRNTDLVQMVLDLFSPYNQ